MSTPDSADDATVGERGCTCPDDDCRETCPACIKLADDDPCVAQVARQRPATPPADDANRAPVSGGEALAARWQEVLAECKAADPRWILDRSVTVLDGALDELRHALKSDRAGLAARDAEHDRYLSANRAAVHAWQERADGERRRAEAAEAERDTARREAGERIAQAKAEALREAAAATNPLTFTPTPYGIRDWLIARADVLTFDDGGGA